MRSFLLISTVLLASHASAQNYYHSEAGPPGYPGGPSGSSPYGFVVPPTNKPSRPSFFRNPLAAASSLHKTVIAGIRAPAFLSNLLPSASAPRPSFFSFAKPPRGFSGPSSFSSFSPEASASSSFPSFFGRPGPSHGSSLGPAPPSFYGGSSSGPSQSPYAGLPPQVISALQSGQFESSISGDQQEAATNLHEVSGHQYDRSPPRIRPGFSSGDDSDISSASGPTHSLSGPPSGSYDATVYSQGPSGSSVAQAYLAQQGDSSGHSGSAPSSIAGYDIGVPVQLGFQSHSSDQSPQGSNNIGPAYQIDTSSIQYNNGYQQSSSGQSQSPQTGYSGLATGYGSGSDASKQNSGYGQGQTFVVGSSLSYDGKTPSTSYSSSPSSGQGYSGYSSSQSNEALVQALKAYANGNVKYVPGKPAVPINHQLQHGSHSAPSYSSSSSSASSSSYSAPISSKSTKYTSSASSTSYSAPVKATGSGYSTPVKSSSIRYSSNSGGLSYAESSPQATKYGQKASSFESTRTVGSSLKFGETPSSSSASSSSSSASASSSAKKSS